MTAKPNAVDLDTADRKFGGDELPTWRGQGLYSRVCEVLSAGFFVAMILSVLAGILFRQVDFGFGRAMQWSVALANIALIWSIFLGTGLVDIEKSHIRVDFVYERLGFRTRTIVDMLGNVLIAVTFILVIPGAIRFAEAAGARSLVGSNITFREIYAIFIFWFAITALNQIFDFFRNWQLLRTRVAGEGVSR